VHRLLEGGLNSQIKNLDGTGPRADLAVTVLDGRAIDAVLRVRRDLGAPTRRGTPSGVIGPLVRARVAVADEGASRRR
jgi:hypothetical protein